MGLLATLKEDVKVAMKARDKARVGTLRMLISAVKNQEIDKRTTLSEAEEVDLLAREAKKRRESIDAFDKAGREELAAKERAELSVIDGYLPKALSREEVLDMVHAAITEIGATSKKDMGRVMKLVMPKTRGRFPGKDVKPLVDEALDKLD